MPTLLITILMGLLTNALSGQPDPVVKVVTALVQKILQSINMDDVTTLVSSLKEGYGEQWVNDLFANLKSTMPNKEVEEIFNKINSYSP